MPWMLYKYKKPIGVRQGLVRFVKAPSFGRFSKCNVLHMAPSNSPDRAKGMQPFNIDGNTVWAGTPGGARKLYRKLIRP